MTLTNIQPLTRLVLSAGVIFGVLAAVAAASSALLQTNEAVALDNQFSVASGDVLRISLDDNGSPAGYGLNVTNPFNANDLLPGQERTYDFWLKNFSNDNLEINLFADLANYEFKNALGESLGSTGSSTDLDADVTVQFFCDSTTSSDGTTEAKTLTSWTNSTTTGKSQFNSPGPGILAAGEEAKCTMTLELGTDSEDAGFSVNFDAIFSGEQVASATSTPVPTP